MKQTVCDARLAGLEGAVCVEIQDCGVWRVRIENGRATVDEGNGEADSVVIVSREDLAGIVAGRLSPMTLFLRGRLKVRGKPDLVLALLRCLPYSEQSRAILGGASH